jgi:hypothetical protein
LARQELIALGLIAYQKPLYQLLSLEGEELTVRESRAPLISRASREQQPPTNSEPQPVPAISGLSLKAMVESLLQKSGETK